MFIVLFEVYPHATQMQQYLDVAKLLRPGLSRSTGLSTMSASRISITQDIFSRSRPGAMRRR